jgi:hypothetical protein
MTISWLTPTTNLQGGFFMSMNADRHSAQLLKRTGRFVLSVPVRGMEATVRAVGGCSGKDNASIDDTKFRRLGLSTCRPGWRAGVDYGASEPAPSVPADAEVPAEDPKRKGGKGGKGGAAARQPSPMAAVSARAAAISDLHGDIAVAGCVAHLVCTVACVLPEMGAGGGLGEEAIGTYASRHSATNQLRSGGPNMGAGTSGHLSVFCSVEAAWVRSKYWANAQFAPRSREVPPYLTFFGGGKFGYAATEEQLAEDPTEPAGDN